MNKKSSNKSKNHALNKGAVSGCRFRVIKHRLGGYSVEKDGRLLDGIFRLKKDATKHMNNLKKMTDAINAKFQNALGGCH